MQKLMRAMHKNEKGFTLVELMVVVVIIGILVAIAIPIYNTVTENAEKRAIEANLRTIDGAIMQFEASGDDPTTAGELGLAADLEGVYLEVIQPTAGETYGIDNTGATPKATVTIDDKQGGLNNATWTLQDILDGSAES